MVRSMYSGVAGMRAQQSAMDTIGNNIANVKTYGYKASRTTFKDVYYQTLKSGSGATASRGGTNPSQIGYGAQLGTIDVLHGQSSFAMTGQAMDMAIAGEGFFQVMDSEGNTFFTRAGQTLFDPEGNLVDSSGNFVLGVSGDPLGKAAGSDKIQLSIPALDPNAASVEEPINNNIIKISAQNNSEAGNVTFSFDSDDTMPDGLPVKAVLTAGGKGITIKMNANHVFANAADLQNEMNKAITEANGGKAHPAGNFTLTMEPADKLNGLTGEEIASKDYSVKPGEFKGATAADKWPSDIFGGMKIQGTSSDFNGAGVASFGAATKIVGPPEAWEITMNIDTQVFKGTITKTDKDQAGTFLLTGTAPATGTITMTHPGYPAMDKLADDPDNPGTPLGTIAAPGSMNGLAGDPDDITINVTPAVPSKALGFKSKGIKLEGGTEGGPQTIANLDSISVSTDGVITAKHAVHGEIPVGRIDLVTFANPQGLIQAGNTYFTKGPNSGNVNYCQPGSNGAGDLVTGSLEQSNVDLSQEFSDMITTQRAYQANSRMITVSDTMLEELVNLKR